MRISGQSNRRFFSSSKKSLLERIKEKPDMLSVGKVVQIMKREPEIDLVSYDYILASILK